MVVSLQSREQAAAVTIQAGFRGYQTRQAISTKKVRHALIANCPAGYSHLYSLFSFALKN